MKILITIIKENADINDSFEDIGKAQEFLEKFRPPNPEPKKEESKVEQEKPKEESKQ